MCIEIAERWAAGVRASLHGILLPQLRDMYLVKEKLVSLLSAPCNSAYPGRACGRDTFGSYCMYSRHAQTAPAHL